MSGDNNKLKKGRDTKSLNFVGSNNGLFITIFLPKGWQTYIFTGNRGERVKSQVALKVEFLNKLKSDQCYLVRHWSSLVVKRCNLDNKVPGWMKSLTAK